MPLACHLLIHQRFDRQFDYPYNNKMNIIKENNNVRIARIEKISDPKNNVHNAYFF